MNTVKLCRAPLGAEVHRRNEQRLRRRIHQLESALRLIKSTPGVYTTEQTTGETFAEIIDAALVRSWLLETRPCPSSPTTSATPSR